MFLCASYIPPQYSSKLVNSKTDYFQKLSETLSKFYNEGNIIIAGDMNSRIGVDSVEENSPNKKVDSLLPPEAIWQSTVHRSSCDTKKIITGKN